MSTHLSASIAANVAAVSLVVIEGCIDSPMRPETAGGPFARLNVWFYSPFYLVLALCTALAVHS